MSKILSSLLQHPLFWVLQSVIAIGYIVSSHGIGLTHDSAMYVFSARGVVEHGSLTDPSGNAMVLYPPLYSWLLSLGLFLHIPIQVWAIVLNVAAHSSIVLLVRNEALKLRHKALQYGLLLSVVYGMPLVQNGVFLWADAPFVAFFLLAGYSIQRYLHQNKKTFFLLAILFTILGIYERYIGVSCVAACCLQIFFFSKKELRTRILEVLIFGFSCTAFFLLWEYRNYISAGTSNHPYDPGIYSLVENLFTTLSIIGSYWIPSNLPILITFLAALGFFLFVAWKIVIHFRQKKIAALQEESIWIFSLVCYLLFFVVLNTVFYICDWDDRYLSPCYPFAMLLFFKTCDDYLHKILSPAALSLFVVLSISYPLVRYFKNAWQWKRNGIGYNSRDWQENKLLRWVKSQKDGVYISNNSMPVIIPGNKTCYFSPIPLKEPAIAIVWKEEFRLNYIEWTQKDLSIHYRVEAGPEFPEGNVYYLFPKK